MSTGAVAITLNAGYIKKNKFPINILFLNVVVSGLIKQLILFAIYFLMYAYVNRSFSLGFLFVLPVLVVFMLLCFGFVQILGSITPYFKDTPHIINLLLRLGMYLSCVLYNIEQIPIKDHSMYLYLNPVASCIILSRYFVFGVNQEYAYPSVISIICWTIVTLIIGHLIVSYIEKDVADVL